MGYSDDGLCTWGDKVVSTKHAAVAFLGAHEFYWWPYKQYLLARVGDGSTFKFFEFSGPTFAFVEQTSHMMVQIPGAITVPPCFLEDDIIFYTSDPTATTGKLLLYWYDPVQE